MYRPANSVPYATVETDLPGVFLKYCTLDPKGRLIIRTGSEVEQKCCSFQHWIHQWTHGNLVVTNLQGGFHGLYKVNANHCLYLYYIPTVMQIAVSIFILSLA